jgi:hypothetical protein
MILSRLEASKPQTVRKVAERQLTAGRDRETVTRRERETAGEILGDDITTA